jgi:molybdenum cofactor cytidylyltransferase
VSNVVHVPGPWSGAKEHASTVVAVLPAAGASSRFGSDKRMALVDGVPMLERVVTQMVQAGVSVVVVGTPAAWSAPAGVPHTSPRVWPVTNEQPERGMFSSIQIGMDAALQRGATIVLVHPADMPFVRTETIRQVIDECARTGRAVCPRHGEKRGHPLAFPAAIAQQLLAVDPSTPLNEAFAAVGLVRHELDVDDAGVLRDVDEPHSLTR